MIKIFKYFKYISILFIFLIPLVVESQVNQYPNQPIKIIMPFAPGSGTELAIRLISERLSNNLKQPVVIENRPGAGTTLGTDVVAKSNPDGYTLLATFNSSIAPGPLMYKKLGYDPIKDFVHISLIGIYPIYLIVKNDNPIKNIEELISYAKNNPGKINYASAGVGTSGFLAAELLKQTLSLEMNHIPYKGPNPALIDLLGGRLDMVLTASAGELVKAGKVRIIAVTSEKRSDAFPEAPSLGEVAKGVHAVSWFGFSAPAQTPKSIVTRLEKEIISIVSTTEMKNKLSDPSVGLIPYVLDSEKFTEFIKNENKFWLPIIKNGNITVE